MKSPHAKNLELHEERQQEQQPPELKLIINYEKFEKTEAIHQFLIRHIHSVIDRFPNVAMRKVRVNMEMQNSPRQTGPDNYRVKLYAEGQRPRRLIIEKSAENLYVAIRQVHESLMHVLGRIKNKQINRKKRRRRSLTERLALLNRSTVEAKEI